jgi:putative transposase
MHHVYARGNNRQRIFLDDADRKLYLRILAGTVGRYSWHCLAYCLMRNHVHLLIETVRPDLGKGMQRLQGTYAQRFNLRHGRSGHLFEHRYGAVPVESDAQLWAVAGYIAMNPVAAGLCNRPEEWTWSSYASVLAGAAPAWVDDERLRGYFGAHGGDPLDRYAERTS